MKRTEDLRRRSSQNSAKIIAEFCQNHRGDLKLLKDMIWAARDAGADYAKIQSVLADELTLRERFENGRTENSRTVTLKRPYQPEYARLKPMDLNDDAHWFFIEECGRAGIEPLTSVITRARIPFLASLPLKTIKVISFDCASRAMIEELKQKFSHLIISTGATYKDEIRRTAAILQGSSFSFLHCVSLYPTPLRKIRLSRIGWLRQLAPSVGFSDHTLVERDGLKASLVALALGAEIIERHFTLLPADQTKDGPVSINAGQLKTLVEAARTPRQLLAREIEKAIPEWREFLGDPEEEISAEEEINRDYYRGRFASRTPKGFVYNWESASLNEDPLSVTC